MGYAQSVPANVAQVWGCELHTTVRLPEPATVPKGFGQCSLARGGNLGAPVQGQE